MMMFASYFLAVMADQLGSPVALLFTVPQQPEAAPHP